MKKPLEGVKVIELSTYAAAPAAGRMLADMGADVIKIEGLTGEPFRTSFGLSVNTPVDEDENPCFQLENANKRSITINLKDPDGKQMLFDLLKDADIFFTNTRINSLKKLGIDYDSIKEKFPKLVYGHISGYGFKGPDYALPGFDITAFWARGGGIADLAFEGKGPISAPYAVGDHASTLAMVSGLLAGLYKAKTTGEGEYVLVSLFGVSVFLNGLMITPCQEGYGDSFPKDEFYPLTPISNTYNCSDNNMVTLTILDYVRDWEKFCTVIERPDLVNDERYNNPDAVKGNYENCKALVQLIKEIFATKPQAHWVELLTKYDLPFSKAQHFKDIPKDPQALENGYIVPFTFPNGSQKFIPCTPVQFKENVAAPCNRAPYLGEHTTEILKGLGYSDEKIADLIARKVTSQHA